MTLIEVDPSLSEICRAVELHVRNIGELAELELRAELLLDFNSLTDPEAKLRGYRLRPALYRLKEQTILVNGANFFSLAEDVSRAALAHEIGHAVYHRDSLGQLVPTYKFLHEDIVADLLACKWGFLGGLRRERLGSYGQRYSEILELWSNEDEFVRRMNTWYQRRLAGII
jgi:hypothetical protein